tara:strand:+ start:3053 stop:4420 length:1368 start_codon:yes stop_codon:yes gene_type:complete
VTDEESEQNDANSDEGVVFANTKLPALGWFVNYAIYDGTINLHNFVESLYEQWREGEGYGENTGNRAEFSSMFGSFIPIPRHGGGAFAHAVRSLQTKAQRVVYDDPENPLTNNKEKMRVRKNGSYGYKVQWNIVPLQKNREYALQRVRRGYVEGQPRLQVFTDSPYRVRIEGKNLTVFTRAWRRELVAHIWEGGKMPDISALTRQVIVEPMEDSALPENAAFMGRAQRRLREAYVAASTSIDDDKIRKIVRRRLRSLGGILPHASSGGVYFIHDREKRYQQTLNRIDTVISHFALMANSRDRDAMWVERESPWWETMSHEDRYDAPIVAHYESGFRMLTYGSSPRQIEDIKKMYISTMQNAQAKYYQLVHKMLQEGEIDEEVLATKKAEALATLTKASNDLGPDTVEAATKAYEEVVEGLTSRFQDMWTPEERVSEQEKQRLDDRIQDLLSLRLS